MSVSPADHFIDEHGIRWHLRAEPAEVRFAERGAVHITIEATNESTAQVNPERHFGQWTLQDEPHPGLMLWFGNGLRAQEWSALPPGHTVTDTRSPGEQLFEAPGRYKIAYTRPKGTAAVWVTVAP